MREILANFHEVVTATSASLILMFCSFLSGHAANLPEPGLVIYGAISGSLAQANVPWQISSTSSSISVNATSISVKSQNFYLATVPLEARSLGSIFPGAATPNTLPLNPVPTTYASPVAVARQSAAISMSSKPLREEPIPPRP